MNNFTNARLELERGIEALLALADDDIIPFAHVAQTLYRVDGAGLDVTAGDALRFLRRLQSNAIKQERLT